MRAVHLAVCICTCKRPQGLLRTLRALDALRFPSAAPDLALVVIDNDAQGSARATVDGARTQLRWPVVYEVEPRQGIPFARNACLRVAFAHGAQLVAFIDDDETPASSWLAELLQALEREQADVVTGPVVPMLPEPIPDWVQRGAFFTPSQHATGTRLDRAFTNNVLLRREVIERLPVWFDERMALTGGSDTHLFQRLARAGASIVWCAEALVYDHVPASRVTPEWLIQRWYRVGTVTTFVRMDLQPKPKALLTTAAASARAGVVGTALCAAGVITGKHVRVKGARWLAYGAGLVAGLRGARYEEYKRIHGD
jgi:succinoglycan biosynthesis protein ExoM